MRRTFATALTVLTAASCGGSDVETCSRWLSDPRNEGNFGRGLVLARFRESVLTEADATLVIERASFRVNSFLVPTAPMTAYVNVPDGRECVSIERLQADPAIESAYPQLLVHAQ